jgi:hypothetical protein
MDADSKSRPSFEEVTGINWFSFKFL